MVFDRGILLLKYYFELFIRKILDFFKLITLELLTLLELN